MTAVPPVIAAIETIHSPIIDNAGISFRALRLDQCCPDLSGNKWFKLKYNLQEARHKGFSRILSFGGCYSNHLHALALAGKHQGVETIGVVRGEQTDPLNKTLKDAVAAGMQLHFVTRSDYRRRYDDDFLADLEQQFGPVYIVPEGGNNLLGAKGCSEILQPFLEERFDTVAIPCGTGNTLAGVIASLPETTRALGIAVLKGESFLKQDVKYLLEAMNAPDFQNWQIDFRFHGGGYAKYGRELARFVKTFSRDYFAIEPVYSGKLFWGLFKMIEAGEFVRGTRLLAIHTGGMQGLRGMQEKIDQLTQCQDGLFGD